MKSQRMNDTTKFSSILYSLLEHEDGHHRCFALVDFARTIDETNHNIHGKVLFYKWASLILVTSVPILSTILSLLLTGNQGNQGNQGSDPLFGVSQAWVIYLSLILTLLTLLNSIFNPGERFKRVCRLGIGIENLKMQAAEQLEAMSSEGAMSHKEVHAIVNKLNKELNYYRRQLIDLFLPELQVKTSKIVNDSFLTRLSSGSETARTPETARASETGTGGAATKGGAGVPAKA